MELNGRQQKWYDLGMADAKRFDFESEAAEAMDPDTLENMVMGRWSNETWYHAGFIGREPEYVQAVRYGKVPECGRSINYTNNTYENGVSCVKIIRNGEDASISSIYDVTLGYQGIAKQTISGWYLGGSGSDGEPLLVDAQ